MNKQVKLSFFTILKLVYFLLMSCIVFSCKKSTSNPQLLPTGKALVKIGSIQSSYESESPLQLKGSKASDRMEDQNAVQRKVQEWDKHFILVSELKAIKPLVTKSSSNENKKVTSSVAQGIVYRVYVYNEEGRFITFRDYRRGQEANSEPLLLDTGIKYTFIALSRNSDNPEHLIDPTLMSRNFVFGTDQDPMFYRKEMILSGSEDNYLNIDFTHLFGQIIITMDATSLGANIRALVMRFNGNSSAGDFNLFTGERLAVRGPTPPAPTWINEGTPIVASAPYILSINPNTTLSLGGRIYIGRERREMTLFNDVVVNPGIKYELDIKFVRKL